MARGRLLLVLAGQWLLLAAMVLVNRAGLPPAVMTAVVLLAAAAQAGLLLWFDMRLGQAPGLVRLVAFGAVGWLAVLFGLGLGDWLTR